jgi:hypothetical protein
MPGWDSATPFKHHGAIFEIHVFVGALAIEAGRFFPARLSVVELAVIGLTSGQS